MKRRVLLAALALLTVSAALPAAERGAQPPPARFESGYERPTVENPEPRADAFIRLPADRPYVIKRLGPEQLEGL